MATLGVHRLGLLLSLVPGLSSVTHIYLSIYLSIHFQAIRERHKRRHPAHARLKSNKDAGPSTVYMRVTVCKSPCETALGFCKRVLTASHGVGAAASTMARI